MRGYISSNVNTEPGQKNRTLVFLFLAHKAANLTSVVNASFAGGVLSCALVLALGHTYRYQEAVLPRIKHVA